MQPRPPRLAAVIPVKSFGTAKERLRTVLGPAQRRRLARSMAGRVLDALAELPCFVVCDDDEVRAWATERGAEVLWSPGLGLNGALDHARRTLAERGWEQLLFVHGDLPLLDRIGPLAVHGTITLAPDRKLDGTNVLSLPSRVPWTFEYGSNSYRRHLRAALASGTPVTVCLHDTARLDVDTPEDLADARLGAWRERGVPPDPGREWGVGETPTPH